MNREVSRKLRENLRQARKLKGMSQKELAEKIGVGNTTVSNWEKGHTEPSLDAISHIAWALDAQINDLIPPFDEINEAILSQQERLFLSKYRTLDPDGKGAVENCLDYEHRRAQTQIKEETVELKLFHMNTDYDKSSVIHIKENPVEYPQIEVPHLIERVAAGFGNYVGENFAHEPMSLPANEIPPRTTFVLSIYGDSMVPRYCPGDIVFIEWLPVLENGDFGVFVLNGDLLCKKYVEDDCTRQVRLVSENAKYEDIVIREYDNFRVWGKVVGVRKMAEKEKGE